MNLSQSAAFPGEEQQTQRTRRSLPAFFAYRLALARPPRDSELRMAREFLAAQEKTIRERQRTGHSVQPTPGFDPAIAAALADFCLALLNCNEFLYIS